MLSPPHFTLLGEALGFPTGHKLAKPIPPTSPPPVITSKKVKLAEQARVVARDELFETNPSIFHQGYALV